MTRTILMFGFGLAAAILAWGLVSPYQTDAYRPEVGTCLAERELARHIFFRNWTITLHEDEYIVLAQDFIDRSNPYAPSFRTEVQVWTQAVPGGWCLFSDAAQT